MSLPRYPEYKDSGVEWINSVPAHWTTAPLKYALDIQNGADHKHVEQSEGFPVIGSGGQFAYASDYLYDGESVLLGRKGTIDKPIYVNGKFWTVDTMYWSRIRPETHGRFIYYAALTIPFDYYSTNTALPSMTKGTLSAHYIAQPPASEQATIAAFLDRETAKIDTLIAEQEKLIALLAEKRQATISHAVTRGMSPHASIKPSNVEWLEDIPEHWNVLRLSALFREVSEPGDTQLPILSVSIHHGVSDRQLDEFELDRKVTRSDDLGKYKRVEPGDLVYNMMRAWQGGFGAVSVHGQVSPAYVVARPIRSVRTEFLELLLRTPNAVEEMRRYSQGVTDFRLRLYWQNFKNVRVSVPPLLEQDAILAFINAESAQIEALKIQSQRSIDLLRERRSALITAAVTGQIDVRGLVKEEAA